MTSSQTNSSQQRAALQRQIWAIANDVRGSVDGWDFKQYVLGTLFYRFISENFAVGIFRHVFEQLAGVDEVALGFDGVFFDLWGDDAVGQFGVVDTFVTGLNVGSKVFTDKAIKQSAQYVLLEVPTIHRASYIIGNRPDLALQGGALL